MRNGKEIWLVFLKITAITNSIHVVLVVLIVKRRKGKDMRDVWVKHKKTKLYFSSNMVFYYTYAKESPDKLLKIIRHRKQYGG